MEGRLSAMTGWRWAEEESQKLGETGLGPNWLNSEKYHWRKPQNNNQLADLRVAGPFPACYTSFSSPSPSEAQAVTFWCI